MARKCIARETLRPVLPAGTLSRMRKGEEVRPITAGRVAQVLGVDVTEILEEEV